MMTTNLFTEYLRPTGLGEFRRPSAHATLVLFLAALAVLGLSAFSLGSHGLGPVVQATSLPTLASLPTPDSAADDSTTAVESVANLPPAGIIDALTGILSKRYRVSQEATRGLVVTAYREASRNGLDPLLVLAVIAVESRFNPIAQSHMGAVGLMQIIPKYHTDKIDTASGQSVLDPVVNIQVGTRVLSEYIGRTGNQAAGLQLYNGSLDDANAGYSDKVLAEKEWLQQAVRRMRAQT
jgi:soluble lytic murein transglycosylase-like protein